MRSAETMIRLGECSGRSYILFGRIHLQGVQRVFFFKLLFFSFLVVIFDIVHDVEAIRVLW